MPSTVTTPIPLATPIGFIGVGVDVQTVVASFGSPGRRDQNNHHTCGICLVNQVLSQLVKRPTVRPSTLSLTARLLVCAFSNACQIFKGNGLTMSFSIVNQGFANRVIQPRLKSLLTTSQPLQQFSASSPRTAGALTGLALENPSHLGVVVSNFAYVLSIPVVSIRGIGNIGSAQVHTQNFVGIDWLWGFLLQTYLQVKTAISSSHQRSTCGLGSFEQSSLVVPDSQRNSFSASQQPQTHRPVLIEKRKDSLVVSCASALELLHRSTFLVGSFAIPCDSTADLLCQVCTQTKPSPNLVVHPVLQFHCIDYFLWRVLVDPVTRLGKYLQSLLKFLHLRGIGVELARDSQYLVHNPILLHQGGL